MLKQRAARKYTEEPSGARPARHYARRMVEFSLGAVPEERGPPQSLLLLSCAHDIFSAG